MNNILTIDIGTTSVKVSVLNDRFQIVAGESMEYLLVTDGNRVELSPGEYISAIEQGVSALSKKTDIQSVTGIAVTTQGETLIPVDTEGKPLYNAVVWLDARAEQQAENIRSVVRPEEFYAATGIPECNGFCPVSKILWFKEELPDIYEKTKYFLLLEDYILYYLTGRFVTEKSLMSTTGYFDIRADRLWGSLLHNIGIDTKKIPEILDCGIVVGNLLPVITKKLALPDGIRVVTGAMDQVCNAIGAGNTCEGVITEVTGTALCIGMTRKTADIDIRLNVPVYRHFSKELQLILPVCMTAGMSLKWFKDVFCESEIDQARELQQSVYDLLGGLADKSPPLSNGITMLPYFSGSLQPVNNQDLRASFNGIGLHCTKADFVRSIMEGVGYMLLENILLLEEISGIKAGRIIAMGGGSKSPIWNRIKASITGRSLVAYSEVETASLGVGILCAAGLGLYDSVQQAVAGISREQQVFPPDQGLINDYQNGFEKYRKILAANQAW